MTIENPTNNPDNEPWKRRFFLGCWKKDQEEIMAKAAEEVELGFDVYEPGEVINEERFNKVPSGRLGMYLLGNRAQDVILFWKKVHEVRKRMDPPEENR